MSDEEVLRFGGQNEYRIINLRAAGETLRLETWRPPRSGPFGSEIEGNWVRIRSSSDSLCRAILKLGPPEASIGG
jgi:hypothetical protein